MSRYETLALDDEGPHVAVLRFDRPDRANAMNTRMGIEIRDLFTDLYVDAGELRCLVMTGRGERAFCAGGDLKERDGMSDAEWRSQHAIFEQMCQAVRACPVPIVAAVNGAAYAGGLELALLADFVYAASSARFALTEVTLGIMPGAMGTQTLPHAVGERRAREIVLTGAPFGAEEALAWGLANRVCEPDALLGEALATANRIAANAPVAVRQAKKSMAMATQVDRHTGQLFEIEAYNRMVGTEDRAEGIRAFNDKRRPEFKGR